MTSPSAFSKERLIRLSEIETRHFWFSGRRRLVQRVLRRCGVRPPARILDFGAGAGSISLLLSGLGYRVTSADFLPGALHTIGHADSRIACVQSRAESPCFKEATFDCVLLLDVLEHVDDERALSEIVPLVTPGGVLLVTVPAFPVLWSFRDVAAGHRRRYRRDDLLKLLGRHRLRIDFLNYYQFLLFPVIAMSRWAGRRNTAWREAEDMPSAPLNLLMRLVTQAELALSAVCRLPFGASLIVGATRR